MLRAILFAFHGALVDDRRLRLAALLRVLAEEGLALPAEACAAAAASDEPGPLAALLVAAGQKAEPLRLLRLSTRRASYYREAVLSQGYPPVAGAAELVQALASAGLTLGVVAEAAHQEVQESLQRMGLGGRFKVLVSADEVKAGKPDPEGYQLALQSLNSIPPLPDRLIHPHEVLAVEGSAAGGEAAQAAGLITLGVTGGVAIPLLDNADLTVETLAGLSADDLQKLYRQLSRL